MLRGGAFKPRTSPYSFQGLKEKGLELLKIAKQETGLRSLPKSCQLIKSNVSWKMWMLFR